MMRGRQGLGHIYAVDGSGRPTTIGNPVRVVAKPLGAEPAILLDAEERRRRQGAVNALKVIGWDSTANDISYADGYGSDADLDVLIGSLDVARLQPGRTPAEKDRFAAAIREVTAIKGAAS